MVEKVFNLDGSREKMMRKGADLIDKLLSSSDVHSKLVTYLREFDGSGYNALLQRLVDVKRYNPENNEELRHAEQVNQIENKRSNFRLPLIRDSD